MAKEFEQRPGESFEHWWYRVNELAPNQFNTILDVATLRKASQ